MALVLDASVVLAWLLPDERSDDARRLMARALRERPRAPSLLVLEVGNALLQAARRARLREATRIELFEVFAGLPIALEPVSAEAATRASELAAAHGLSLYDASYLELAIARGVALATFDDGLSAAARAAGVTVLASG